MNKFCFTQLITSKTIPESFFTDDIIDIHQPIREHTKKIYEIYKIPYIIDNVKQPRLYHGIAHVSRVAFYIPILFHFYKRYDTSLDISPENIKLLQIAALFHDAGREGEEKDEWEFDSAMLFYFYATKVININSEKAKLFAEVIANKDYQENGIFYRMRVQIDSDPLFITWENEENSQEKKTFFQNILCDADILDIIRARDKFEGTYLDFFKKYVQPNEKNFAQTKIFSQPLLEMAQLICEIRSLIEHCGDTRRAHLPKKQKKFNSPECYQHISDIIVKNDTDFPAMSFLIDHHLMSDNPRLYKEEDDQTDNFIVFRGIRGPSMVSSFQIATQDDYAFSNVGRKHPCTAETEIAMIYGRNCVYPEQPNGNHQRSVSILGMGGGIFSSVGVGCIASVEEMVKIFTRGDGDSGFGRQKIKEPNSSALEKFQALYDLKRALYLGGVQYDTNFSHTEVLMTLEKIDRIIFSNDPNLSTALFTTAYRAKENIPLLEALFLHDLHINYVSFLPNHSIYEDMPLSLPIYEYSSLHKTFKEVRYPSSDEIFSIWEKLITDFFNSEHPLINFNCVNEMLLDRLKALMCYGFFAAHNDYIFISYALRPLDRFYPSNLKNRINQFIKIKIDHLKKPAISLQQEEMLQKEVSLNDLIEKLIKSFFDPAFLKILKEVAEKKLQAECRTNGDRGYKALRRIFEIIKNNPDDSNLLDLLEIVVKNTLLDAFIQPFNSISEAPLRLFFEILDLNTTNLRLNKIAKIIAEETPREAWLPFTSGNALGKFFFIIGKNPHNQHIIDLGKVLIQRLLPEHFVGTLIYEDGTWSGYNALLCILEIIRDNLEPDLLEIAKIAAQNAAPEAWSHVINQENLKGETPLRFLFELLEFNPTNFGLLEIAKIAAQNAKPEAWSMRITENVSCIGDTALRRIFSVLRKNPLYHIMVIAKIATKNALPMACHIPLKSNNDTALGNFNKVFAHYPDNAILIEISEIFPKKNEAANFLYDNHLHENPHLLFSHKNISKISIYSDAVATEHDDNSSDSEEVWGEADDMYRDLDPVLEL